MAGKDKLPPGGLHPQLVNRLLDALESDQDFRARFQSSPEDALRSLGYTDPWECLQLRDGAKLASPEQIRAQRGKLEATLFNVQHLVCPLEVQEGF